MTNEYKTIYDQYYEVALGRPSICIIPKWYLQYFILVFDTMIINNSSLKYVTLNPISGRLLATPISGKGGCLGPPLEISGSYRSIFKIQTAFVSSQHDLHF